MGLLTSSDFRIHRLILIHPDIFLLNEYLGKIYNRVALFNLSTSCKLPSFKREIATGLFRCIADAVQFNTFSYIQIALACTICLSINHHFCIASNYSNDFPYHYTGVVNDWVLLFQISNMHFIFFTYSRGPFKIFPGFFSTGFLRTIPPSVVHRLSATYI